MKDLQVEADKRNATLLEHTELTERYIRELQWWCVRDGKLARVSLELATEDERENVVAVVKHKLARNEQQLEDNRRELDFLVTCGQACIRAGLTRQEIELLAKGKPQ